MEKILLLLLSISICLSLIGCTKQSGGSNSSLNSFSSSSESSSVTVKTVEESLGNVSYEIPATWERGDVDNNNANLYYPLIGSVLLITNEGSDLEGIMENIEIQNIFIEGFTKDFEGSKIIEDPHTIEIIPNYNSIGFILESDIQGESYTVDCVIIQNESDYYFFSMFYIDSDKTQAIYDQYQDVLKSIIFTGLEELTFGDLVL